jgi:predicted alpha/beta superfamily hydrolase
MFQKFISFLLLIVSHSLITSAQVTVTVTSIPDNTPENASIYIVGNFNNWNPADENYLLEKQTDNTYTVELAAGQGTLEYKFTRGSWEAEEADANGATISNRKFTYGSSSVISVEILTWKDLENGIGGDNSTASENVSIMDVAFYIPQLDRNRRIWLYLPKGYESSTQAYPVIYMHDAQNLFDRSTSFAGEWKVDETLDDLIAKGGTPCIIVGIDNGGSFRIDELTPWSNAKYGGGDGDKYIKFIVETLKPHIDANYRTLSAQENTGIMGSSLGGLISYYAGIEYHDTFGMVGVFSPSFWYSSEVYPFTDTFTNKNSTKFFFLAGEKEGEGGSVVREVSQVVDRLKATGLPSESIRSVVKSDGTHSEWFWAREFPQAFQWLIGDPIVTEVKPTLKKKIEIYPNPAREIIHITIDKSISSTTSITVFNGRMGEILHCQMVPTAGLAIDTSNWKPGIYFIQMTTDDQNYFKKIIIN